MPKKKSKSQNNFLYTVLIVIFSVILIGFAFSVTKNIFSDGVSIPKPDLTNEQVVKSAVELYEENPISEITIEILNGCGEKGIAGKIADFLRTEHIDVIRSENADNFDYANTMLIQNSDDLYNVKTVAKVLELDLNDAEHVMFLPESDSDVDLTLIIGSDYKTIKPLRVYLANL